MKKYLIFASAALVALASCTLEITPTIQEKDNEENTILITFASERPQLVNDTKTEWNGDKIVWSSDDKIRVGYTKDGSWMGQSEPGTAKFYKSNNVSIDGGNASKGYFSVPISGSAFTDPAVSGVYQFYAVSPGDAISETTVDDPAAKNITVPSTQVPGVNTFDKRADILVGKTGELDLDALPTDPINLSWTRLVAHADLTFSELDFDGAEVVNRIKLTFNSEAKVAGSVLVNIPACTADTGNTNIITLNGENITSGADYAEAWACVLPVRFTSLSVEIKTDKAIYSRDITGIDLTFKQNARNTLTVNMSTATRTLITELVENGDYVIAALSSDTYYAISSAANGSRRDRSEITTVDFDPNDYSLGSPYTAANNLIWTVTNVSGGIMINLVGDTDSYMSYTSNGISLNSTGSKISVENGSTAGSFKLLSTSYMQMNGSSGFGFYASNVGTKEFYFIPATGTPTITFPVTSKIVPAETTSVEFAYTSVFLASGPSVSVTSDPGSAVAGTTISGGTLTVTLNENTIASDKSVTLTVSSPGASDVVLTITQGGAVGDASNGDTLWAEAFTGFSDEDVPTASNLNTTVYGSRSVTYSCVNGGSTTQVYGSDNNAGGVAPELLISKSSGSFTVSGIPTGNTTGMTLSFKTKNGSIAVTSATPSATVASNSGTSTAPIYGITVPENTKTLTLTFTNSDASKNSRIDDIVLIAGAPIPGILVATQAATSTASAAGTTATLNGSLTLINGAVNSSVSEAGFYYKLSGAGSYTKVTCAVAPTSKNTFSYDLTGLTKDAEYTYYAYAKYDGGAEVSGEETAKEFTPTQTSGVNFSFSRSGSANTVTTGYALTIENGKANADNYQDKNGSVGLDLFLKKSDNSAIFSSSPSSISITVSVGGGSARNPLTNNVVAYLVDNNGDNIPSTETIVTTKVEETTGKEYTVSIPIVSSAYGLRISHAKESGYNVRVYSISFSAE